MASLFALMLVSFFPDASFAIFDASAPWKERIGGLMVVLLWCLHSLGFALVAYLSLALAKASAAKAGSTPPLDALAVHGIKHEH
jgi:hypothetical protein